MATHGKNSKPQLKKEGEGKLRPKPVKEVEAHHAPKHAGKPAKPSPSAVKKIMTPAYHETVSGSKQTQELEHAPSAAPKPGSGPRRKHALPTPAPHGVRKKE